MDAEKSCIQLAERRKETTFQMCSPATKFLNLGKKGDGFVIYKSFS